MILSVIVLVLLLAVAYFHYAQGLFSATLSTIFVVTAAVFAVAYHETVAEKLLNGKMGDSGNAICLVLLFVVSYVVLRIVFDKAVPGNVSFPLALDRVGGAVMGLVAGVFATGVFALAAQLLPFGPAVAGYSPYDLNSAQAVTIPTDQQYLDSTMYDAMKDPTLDPAKAKTLLVPVDDILLSTVQRLSDGGTLAGEQSLAAVHPDYPVEAFGTRLGVQVGAKHTALNTLGSDQVKLGGLYALTALPAVDGELKEMRGPDFMKPKVVSGAAQVLLVARLMIEASAADDADHLFRFSPGSIRLVANQKDYFPVGTVDSADLLMLSRPDDFLFLDISSTSEQGVDVAFLVDKSDLLGGSAANPKVLDGTFIAVKRMARVDLSGASLQGSYTASSDVKVLRQKALAEQIQKFPPPQATIGTAVASAAPTAPVRGAAGMSGGPAMAAVRSGGSAAASAARGATDSAASRLGGAIGAATGSIGIEIPIKIGVNTSDGDAQDVSVAGGTVSLKDSRVTSANIEPTASVDKLATGDSTISELFVPDGKVLVQVASRPSAAVPQLIDSGGASTSANGYFGTVTTGAGSSVFLHYYAGRAVSAVAAPPAAGTVTYLFVISSGATPTQLSINGSTLPVAISGK